MAIHPAPTPGKTLAVPHFPTEFQTVIFRLWECVPCKKLAEVLQTTEENIDRAAADMGLGEQLFLDKWHSRGYITILRAIWNVLPYEQILQLLDYTQERLKFILKEDESIRIPGFVLRKTGDFQCLDSFHKWLVNIQCQAYGAVV